MDQFASRFCCTAYFFCSVFSSHQIFICAQCCLLLHISCCLIWQPLISSFPMPDESTPCQSGKQACRDCPKLDMWIRFCRFHGSEWIYSWSGWREGRGEHKDRAATWLKLRWHEDLLNWNSWCPLGGPENVHSELRTEEFRVLRWCIGCVIKLLVLKSEL